MTDSRLSPLRSNGLRTRLADWLGLHPTAPDLVDVIAGLQAEIGTLNQSLVSLQAQVERLEKQQARTGKEQYKANLLAESQQQSAKDMLTQLRENEAYRERDLAALREQLTNARGEGRLEVARQILAAIDSLDEAIASGERWLSQSREKRKVVPAAEAVPHPSLFTRLIHPTQPRLLEGAHPSSEDLKDDIRAWNTWLEGLDLIRRRLLDVLAAQGITPMDLEGARFDPARHIAAETIPADAEWEPGQIVQVHRRGYQRGETVLRYAEVVVAR